MRLQVTSAGIVEQRPEGFPDHPAKRRNQIARHLGKVIARLLQIVNEGIRDEIRRAGGLVRRDNRRDSLWLDWKTPQGRVLRGYPRAFTRESTPPTPRGESPVLVWGCRMRPVRIFRDIAPLDAFLMTEDCRMLAEHLGFIAGNPVVWIGRLFALDNDDGEHWFDHWA